MKYLLCTFADADKKDKNYLTTYQVRKVIESNEYSDELLVDIAEKYDDGGRKIAFVFTDEEIPKQVRYTYLWCGYRYFEDNRMQPLNTNLLKVIR